MKTADKIRRFRQKKGLTQEALGEIVGLQKAAINKYETGRVTNIKNDILIKLADALGVLPIDLMDSSVVNDDARYLDIMSRKDIWLPENRTVLHILNTLMSPTLQLGDVVVVKQQPFIDHDDQIVLVSVDGNPPTLMRAHRYENSIMLSYDNADGVDSLLYSKDEIDKHVKLEGVAEKFIRHI